MNSVQGIHKIHFHSENHKTIKDIWTVFFFTLFLNQKLQKVLHESTEYKA